MPECAKLVHWKSTLGGNTRTNFFAHIIRANPWKVYLHGHFYILLRIELLTPNIHICWQEAMRHLKETMFPCHYPLQLPNLNPVSRIFSNSFSSTKVYLRVFGVLRWLSLFISGCLGWCFNPSVPHKIFQKNLSFYGWELVKFSIVWSTTELQNLELLTFCLLGSIWLCNNCSSYLLSSHKSETFSKKMILLLEIQCIYWAWNQWVKTLAYNFFAFKKLHIPADLNGIEKLSFWSKLRHLYFCQAFLLGKQENLQRFSTPSMSSVPLIIFLVLRWRIL